MDLERGSRARGARRLRDPARIVLSPFLISVAVTLLRLGGELLHWSPRFFSTATWGTHYDYVGMPPQFRMPLLPRFLWLALFPQMVFWTSFTVVLGCASGGLYLVAERARGQRQGERGEG